MVTVNPTDLPETITKGRLGELADTAEAYVALNQLTQAVPDLQADVASIEADVASVVAGAPTTDELVGSQLVVSWPSSTALAQSFTSSTGALPIFVAPFALEITYFAAVWRFHSYAQNDTNYLRLRLYRRRAGSATTIVTKSTQTTPSGGEAVTALIPWNFNAQTWDTAAAQFNAEDALEADWPIAGTFTVNMPVLFVWKYRPL